MKNGTEVNHRITIGEIPLSIAAKRGKTDFVKLLIEHGADVNKEDRFGMTPIMHACAGGHLDVVKILYENGADIYKKDDRKRNAKNHTRSAKQDKAKLIYDYFKSVDPKKK